MNNLVSAYFDLAEINAIEHNTMYMSDYVEQLDKIAKLKVTISEGKNRQIRKMFEVIEKNITLLRRTQIGEIALGGLSRGEYVPLNAKELKYLRGLKK